MSMNPRLLRPLAPSGDSDVRAYIAAVEAADGEPLEQAVKDAYRDFITGCKADGIWDAIKASCILAGARTLAGALVPLKGAAPTNKNFVSGDYNRETGLVGDGSTKYLDSNRSGTADPRNDAHVSVYIGAVAGVGSTTLATIGSGAGATNIGRSSATHTHRIRSNASTNVVASPAPTGLRGLSRSSSASYDRLLQGTVTNDVVASDGDSSANYFLLAAAGPTAFGTDRVAFYSIGESLDLEALDTRVSALITAIGAAI